MITCLVLGSGGAVPTRARAPAAYWVTVDGRSALLDPGPGALARLVASPRGPSSVDDLDTVLLSHLHLDHCADLAPLLFALHSPLPRRETPLVLAGPPGLAAYLQRLRDLYGDWLAPARRQVIVHELPPGTLLAPGNPAEPAWRPARDAARGPCLTAFAANHGERRFSSVNLGFRFCDAAGGVFVYAGDGEDGPDLRQAATGADLLVVECSTPDELATPGHMTPSAIATLCRAAGPRRVILTHLYPPADALDLPALVARHGWTGAVAVAQDGAVYGVPSDRLEPGDGGGH